MSNAAIRAHIPALGGLAFLWLALQASPYFPVSLALNSSTADVSIISACHTVYTLLFCLFAVLVALWPQRTAVRLAQLRFSGALIGIVGALGAALLAAVPSFPPSALTNAGLGCGMMLVALFVVCAVVLWGQQVSGKGFTATAILVTGSYITSSLLWLAWTAWGPSTTYLLVTCPLLSGLCLQAAARQSTPQSSSPSQPITPTLLWPCVAIVYAAVLLVRVLTTMQAGLSVGSLNANQQIVSAAVQAIVAVLFAGSFGVLRAQSPSRRALVTFGVLVVVFLGALLQVVLTGNVQSSSFLGRRTLVGLEHCFELMAFIILVYNGAASSTRLARNLAAFAVGVLAIPQFVSLDLFYHVGVMDLLVDLDLVVPIAAIASFFVAVLLVGLLTTGSASPTPAPEQSPAQTADPSAWQEELCHQVVDHLDVSTREFEVMLLAYRGYSSPNIARQLAVSESTIKTHLTHLYRKLGIHSRQELIALIDSKRPQT